ncbi:MAG: S8 family serine peptidase [Bacillota bacterium]
MKIIKELISKLPFTIYSHKVDSVVREIVAVKKAKYLPLVVIFRQEPDALQLSRLKRLGFKIKYTLPFLRAVSGRLPMRSFETLAGILDIEKIYYDGKAVLMGKPLKNNLSSAKDPRTILAQKTDPTAKPVHLSGKGITAAFIDSGVFPHPDLTKPKNRIAAFKDFINGMDFPYDDNGHGTACIGAGFGASTDGKFKALAYDSSIVCAKAFDEFSTGFFSDILAAMQWILNIKEQHNIKIVVLPFGTTSFSRRFDLLGRAALALWSSGLFVSCCAGNMGPIESSICSPGVCPACFTTGSCNTHGYPYAVADFSGRGPVYAKVDKPDAVMPGCNITTLNCDKTYSPRNKMYYDFGKLSIKYTEASGTSVSASMTAAAAALIYQKNAALSPEDVKSIIKVCTVSLNELKIVQGAGIIDIKKLEEL